MPLAQLSKWPPQANMPTTLHCGNLMKNGSKTMTIGSHQDDIRSIEHTNKDLAPIVDDLDIADHDITIRCQISISDQQ